MKSKMIFPVLVVLVISAGIAWIAARHSLASNTATSGGRKALYYTCAMHPWVRESKPGPCPVCGMNLTPIYANESGGIAETNSNSGMVTLEPESISTINVQTDLVERRPVSRMLHLSGEIVGNAANIAWFEFTAYERDLQWLKIGQTFDVNVSSAPDKIYHAQIKLHGVKPFTDANFDMMSGSTTMRAEILNPPVEAGDFGKNKLFNGLHAEAHVVAETEEVLTVPRSAVISRGIGPMVYVDNGDGHYAPRAVRLGRIGDEFSEVLAGLKEGEKVVTTGNVLIDSEAQLTAGQ
jgi:multidrug efflux pump subunit AcrA (membrane-fusion protein)